MSQAKVKEAQDYKVSIVVHKSPKEVFASINNVRGWWIGEIEGEADKLGSEFTYSFKDFHETTQKVTELIPNKKIVWHVTKSKIKFVSNQNEWKDTDIIFELTPEGDSTRITLTHSGLTPAIQCYDNCSAGWDFFIQKSLQNFILKGKGIAPNF
jgi:hypothetical protein